MRPTKDLSGFAFSGVHEGVTFSCVPARYGAGMVLTLERTAPDMWKDRASWLAEGCGGKWARGHQPGYRIAPTRAAQWRKLFLAGWEANCWIMASRPKPTFRLDGPEVSLSEALRQIETATPVSQP